MKYQKATEQSLRAEPAGLWNYEQTSVDFDEKQNRKTYWMIRDNPENVHLSDEEVKNVVASIKELAVIAYHIYLTKVANNEDELNEV